MGETETTADDFDPLPLETPSHGVSTEQHSEPPKEDDSSQLPPINPLAAGCDSDATQSAHEDEPQPEIQMRGPQSSSISLLPRATSVVGAAEAIITPLVWAGQVARDILSTTRHTVSSFHDDGREAYETATEDAGDMPLSAATLATLSDRLDYLVHDPDMTVESVQVGLINLMMQDDSIASSLGVSQESATEQAYRSSALVRAAMSVGGSLYTHLRRDSAQPRYGTHGAARAEQQSADDTSNAIPSVE